MDNNTAIHNKYANFLCDLKDEYHQKVNNLIVTAKNFDTLNWKTFSEDLDAIRSEYDTAVYRALLFSTIEKDGINTKNSFEEAIVIIKDFKTLCKKQFDEIYEEYNKTNSLRFL